MSSSIESVSYIKLSNMGLSNTIFNGQMHVPCTAWIHSAGVGVGVEGKSVLLRELKKQQPKQFSICIFIHREAK